MAAASSNNGDDKDLPPQKDDQGDTDEGSDRRKTKGDPDEGSGKFWCEYCRQLLNGPQQADEHKSGRRHRKHSTKALIELPDDGVHTLSEESYSILSSLLHGRGRSSSSIAAGCAGSRTPTIEQPFRRPLQRLP